MSPVAQEECPICRAPITSEGRNLLVDNMIDAMVKTLSEETRNRRKELVHQRQELVKKLNEKKMSGHIRMFLSDTTPSSYQPTNNEVLGRPRRAAGRTGMDL